MLELVQPVLVLVIGYLLKLAVKALKIELEEAVFNSIVAAVVVWLLAIAGIEAGVRAGLL